MYRPFREYHILNILNGYDQQSLPLDLFLNNYFRTHKAIGSKDRGVIAETVYGIVRWKGLLDFLCESNTSWEKRLYYFFDPRFEKAKQQKDIPHHIRLSFPKVLFDCLVASHGIEKACAICSVSNTAAPTTVRVNPLKTTRKAMLERWQERYLVRPCEHAPDGIIFEKRINFFELPEFKEGLFEVQDEGSQLIAELVQAQPKDLVMDYCAGAGGKTLAFAPRMQNKGQIFLHDIRKHALLDCRKRLRRAGIQNAQVIHEDDSKLDRLKKNMDWVLVDAPCTGTGTLRRNPDMRWKFSDEMMGRLQGQQRMIFEKALSFVKPGRHIIYATCSVLKEENQDQVAHFIKTYGLILARDPFEVLPQLDGMDGFYGALFVKK